MNPNSAKKPKLNVLTVQVSEMLMDWLKLKNSNKVLKVFVFP